MNISYKYFVGQRFFVPRVREIYERKTVTVDGLEYERIDTEYHPHVKEKIIDAIEIYIDDKISRVTYTCADIDEKRGHTLYTYIDEDSMNCMTHDEAMEVAMHHASRGETCYDY